MPQSLNFLLYGEPLFDKEEVRRELGMTCFPYQVYLCYENWESLEIFWFSLKLYIEGDPEIRSTTKYDCLSDRILWLSGEATIGIWGRTYDQ